MKRFIVNVDFNADTHREASEIAEHHGVDEADRYLVRLIETTLEGGNVDGVTVTGPVAVPQDGSTDVNLTAIELGMLLDLLGEAIPANPEPDARKATWRKLHRALGDIALKEIREAMALIEPTDPNAR